MGSRDIALSIWAECCDSATGGVRLVRQAASGRVVSLTIHPIVAVVEGMQQRPGEVDVRDDRPKVSHSAEKALTAFDLHVGGLAAVAQFPGMRNRSTTLVSGCDSTLSNLLWMHAAAGRLGG